LELSTKKYIRSTDFIEGQNSVVIILDDEHYIFNIELANKSSFFSLQKEDEEHFLYNFSEKNKTFPSDIAEAAVPVESTIDKNEGLDEKKSRFREKEDLPSSTSKKIVEKETPESMAIAVQSDSSQRLKFNVSSPIPKRAALYSALFPGLGQVYNKQYWKLGLVGAGVGVATGFIIFNNSQYSTYRRAYISRIDNNPETVDSFGYYTTADLNTLQSQYRTYLEYTVVATVIGYGLNVLDAFVAGHLRSFDVSPSLSVRPTPILIGNQVSLGLSVKKKF